MNKSWKTTVAGGIAALGVFIGTQTQYAWSGMASQILQGLGTFLIGMFARDRNVTSEAQGAK